MEIELNPETTVLDKFKAFEVKNTKAIKGGDGDDTGDEGIIGSSDIADV